MPPQKVKVSARSAQKDTVTPVPPPASKFKSAERVEESESESESSDTSSEEQEAEAALKPRVSKPMTNRSKPTATSSTSGSDSNDSEPESTGSESEEEDGSSSEDEGSGLSQAAERSGVAKSMNSVPGVNTVSFKDAPPFKPPKGFESRTMDGNLSNASKLFKKADLEGKQIWYITAPASLPISSIKDMSLESMKNGKAAIRYNGNDYGFVHDTAEDVEFTKVMVPNVSDDGYQLSRAAISKVLHLQEMVELPSIHCNKDKSSSLPSRATVPAMKPIRQQPKGLRMRFTPIGFGSGNAGIIGSSESDSDEDMAGVSPKRFKTLVGPDSENSDVEMQDSPVVPTSKVSSKSKYDKPASSKESKPTEKKRKHKNKAAKV